MRQLLMAVAGASLLTYTLSAAAQTFPDDGDWEPFHCDDDPMSDGYNDEPMAQGPRDVVGNANAPAGYRAFDEEFLYLRLRVDQDPTQGTAFQPFAWGVEVDLDEDRSTYELLMMVNGVDDTVDLYRNTDTAQANDPGDPADDPAAASYDTDTHAAAKVLGGSSFGDDDDFAVDLAIPWSDLEPLGLEVDTAASVWVGTSSTAGALDGDIACHDGASGDPNLSDTASDATTADPDTDSDGDGFTDEEELRAGTDPNDPDSTPGGNAGDGQLEGGGGCATAGGSGGWRGMLLAVFVGFVLRRRRPQAM